MSKKLFRNTAITTMAATATVAAVAPAVSADEIDFSDLDQSNEHIDEVQALVAQGAIEGYEDGTFQPFESIDRGQVAKILANTLDLEMPENVEELVAGYDDVDASDQYADAIAAVTKANIFDGGKDDNFNTWDHISREQMAKVLVEAFDLEKYDNGEDVELNTDEISQEQVDYVQTLANLGITDKPGDFQGWDDVQRDQFASFVVRAQELVEQYEAPTININSESTVNVDYGVDFTVPEATAEDNQDGSVEVTTKITDSEGNSVDKIDTTEADSYIVTYTAEDEAGNKSATAITVNVVGEDTEAPEVNIDSESTVNVDYGADFTVPEATAKDNRDDSVEVTTQITDSERNNVEQIDTTKAGNYIVTYTAEDKAGNKSVRSITVVVAEDNSGESNVSFSNVTANAEAPNEGALNDDIYMYEVTGTVSNVDKGEELDFTFYTDKQDEGQNFTTTVDADGDFNLSPDLVDVEGAPDTVDISYTDDGETTEKTYDFDKYLKDSNDK